MAWYDQPSRLTKWQADMPWEGINEAQKTYTRAFYPMTPQSTQMAKDIDVVAAQLVPGTKGLDGKTWWAEQQGPGMWKMVSSDGEVVPLTRWVELNWNTTLEQAAADARKEELKVEPAETPLGVTGGALNTKAYADMTPDEQVAYLASLGIGGKMTANEQAQMDYYNRGLDEEIKAREIQNRLDYQQWAAQTMRDPLNWIQQSFITRGQPVPTWAQTNWNYDMPSWLTGGGQTGGGGGGTPVPINPPTTELPITDPNDPRYQVPTGTSTQPYLPYQPTSPWLHSAWQPSWGIAPQATMTSPYVSLDPITRRPIARRITNPNDPEYQARLNPSGVTPGFDPNISGGF